MNITELTNHQLRNQIRGALANTNTKTRYSTLATARRLLHLKDVSALVSIFTTTDLDEFYFGPPFPDNLHTIFRPIQRQPIELELEIEEQLHRLTHHRDKLLLAASDIGRINDSLLRSDLILTGELIQNFISAYGLSAFMAKKVIYFHFTAAMSLDIDVPEFQRTVSGPLLAHFIGAGESSLYSQHINLLLDICDAGTNCFQARFDHLSLWRRSQPDQHEHRLIDLLMQRILYPTHCSTILNSTSLLYFSSSTLLDLLTDLTAISHCLPSTAASRSKLLNHPTLMEARNRLRPSRSALEAFLSRRYSASTEEAAYRAGFVFSELRSFARWRHVLDVELRVRENLLPKTEQPCFSYFPSNLSLSQLCNDPKSSIRTLQRFEQYHAQPFLRTIAVLNRLRAGDTLTSLSPLDIRILLSQTSNFSKLLDENELLALQDQSRHDDSPIIIFLTMVMLNERKPSEDLAFDMRMEFQNIVIDSFNSDILSFLKWLFARTPNLCPPLVDLFDISFLERLYIINASFAEVLQKREEICRWAAHELSWPELNLVADKLALDSKVRVIRGKIDDTRIFVDDLRYQQWASDRLAPLLRKFERVVAVSLPTHDSGVAGTGGAVGETQTETAAGQFWFGYACQVAFSEFCHNNMFGIDSYLSRRVRHGTLAGTLVAPIQNKIAEYKDRLGEGISENEGAALNLLFEKYRRLVERLRDDLLHFKDSERQHGWLTPGSAATVARARLQVDFQRKMVDYVRGGHTTAELYPLFLEHCWNLLAGDLLRVQEELKNYYSSAVRPMLRKEADASRRASGWRPFLLEGDRLCEELFSTVASWFVRSEGPSMTVRIEELVEVVVQEVRHYKPGYKGDVEIARGRERSLIGIAYQTAYDILFICFTNIADYSEPDQAVVVEAEFVEVSSGFGSVFQMSITSKNRQQDTDDVVRQRIESALATDRSGGAMVREGNSGLAKARTLMSAYGPGGTFHYEVGGGSCRIAIGMPIILV